MAKLLNEALSCEFALAYVHRLLAAFPIDHSEDASKSQAKTNEFDWVEPLGKRE